MLGKRFGFCQFWSRKGKIWFLLVPVSEYLMLQNWSCDWSQSLPQSEHVCWEGFQVSGICRCMGVVKLSTELIANANIGQNARTPGFCSCASECGPEHCALSFMIPEMVFSLRLSLCSSWVSHSSVRFLHISSSSPEKSYPRTIFFVVARKKLSSHAKTPKKTWKTLYNHDWTMTDWTDSTRTDWARGVWHTHDSLGTWKR